MTREEAISEIQRIIFELGFEDTTSTDKRVDALNIAINALDREQQFLDAGYKNGRVEFHIGGRKFMVKELAQ